MPTNSCRPLILTGSLKLEMDLTLWGRGMAPSCVIQWPRKSMVERPNSHLATLMTRHVPEFIQTTGADEVCVLLYF